jgi:hypothetical protein
MRPTRSPASRTSGSQRCQASAESRAQSAAYSASAADAARGIAPIEWLQRWT